MPQYPRRTSESHDQPLDIELAASGSDKRNALWLGCRRGMSVHERVSMDTCGNDSCIHHLSHQLVDRRHSKSPRCFSMHSRIQAGRLYVAWRPPLVDHKNQPTYETFPTNNIERSLSAVVLLFSSTSLISSSSQSHQKFITEISQSRRNATVYPVQDPSSLPQVAYLPSEMMPRHTDSITTSDQRILDLGTSRICIRVHCSDPRPSGSLASWQDGDSVIHVLQRDTPATESLEFDYKLIHEAGSSNAVWTLGNNAVCKVHPWKEGSDMEADTLAFISKEFPSIPITEVISTWVDKPINRSFLILKRIHARTIDQAWADLSHQQRLNLAKEVAQYTALIATKTSNQYQTVSGCGVRFGPGQGYPRDSPIHHWFPRTIGPMPAAEYRAYLKSLSSNPLPDFDDTLVLVHDDVCPSNVLVADDGNSVAAIIDWANVAYYPRFWVGTALYCNGGFILEDEKVPEAERWDWARMFAAALKEQGFHESKEQYRAWMKEVADCDTEKDLAE